MTLDEESMCRIAAGFAQYDQSHSSPFEPCDSCATQAPTCAERYVLYIQIRSGKSTDSLAMQSVGAPWSVNPNVSPCQTPK